MVTGIAREEARSSKENVQNGKCKKSLATDRIRNFTISASSDPDNAILRRYVLTLMNVVSAIYADPTLGANLQVK